MHGGDSGGGGGGFESGSQISSYLIKKLQVRSKSCWFDKKISQLERTRTQKLIPRKIVGCVGFEFSTPGRFWICSFSMKFTIFLIVGTFENVLIAFFVLFQKSWRPPHANTTFFLQRLTPLVNDPITGWIESS